MDYVGLVLAGLVLLIFHVLTLFVMIQDIKRMISCTEKVDAKVETITVKRHRHKDSKTGKTKTTRSYEVTFQYDYNGQTYESFHTYSKRCRYSENEITNIKIEQLLDFSDMYEELICWFNDNEISFPFKDDPADLKKSLSQAVRFERKRIRY